MSEELKMEENQSKRAFLTQTYISVTIVVISFCTGLIEIDGQEQLLKIIDHEESNVFNELFAWRNICQSTVPFVGVILLTVIAEYVGRKAAFGVIILLTMTASSLSIPETILCLKLAHIASTMSSGGQIILFYICIAEYCEPKHRLVFSIANVTVNRMGYFLGKLAHQYLCDVVQICYVKYFEIFLETVCLVSLLTWPESPYWLALKGRQEQSMKSFLLLRYDCTASEKELKATSESRGHPDSFKLFFLPLFVTILQFSTFWCSILFQNDRMIIRWVLDYSVFYPILMECLIILALYKAISFYYKYGRIIIILALIFSVTFQYASTITSYLFIEDDSSFIDMVKLVLFSACYISVVIGPTTFSIAKFAEYIPLKRRSLLMCISGICFFLIKITYIYLASIIEVKFGNYVLPLVLTTIMLLGIVLACFLVPRTEGRTLTEIEGLYLAKR